MTPQFSLRENCDVAPSAEENQTARRFRNVCLISLEEMTSEFFGGASPENSGVSDFPSYSDLMIS
jgi:hypothetical protein